jgi:hypothetical protein
MKERSDEGRGSGMGGIHFREERGRTRSRLGAVARQRLGGGGWRLGDGRRKDVGGEAYWVKGRGNGGEVGWAGTGQILKRRERGKSI